MLYRVIGISHEALLFNKRNILGASDDNEFSFMTFFKLCLQFVFVLISRSLFTEAL